MPGQVSGESLTDAEGTADTLPDDLRHTVRFEVIAEKVTDGALAESTLLNVTRTSQDLANAPILLVNVDPSGLKAVGVDIAGGLEGWKSYVAVLGIGDDAWTSSDSSSSRPIAASSRRRNQRRRARRPPNGCR